MVAGPDEMSRQRNDAPEKTRPAFDGMIFAAQLFWPQKSGDMISVTSHFGRLPSGKMFLQAIVGCVPLLKKTARGEENDFLRRNLFHVLHHLQTIRLDNMFDDVKADTGVKLFGA